MNARLNRFLPEGIYAAATAVCVDERNCTIPLVKAGLPYPFVLRSGQRRLDEVPCPAFRLECSLELVSILMRFAGSK
jgi:hypothetical protein